MCSKPKSARKNIMSAGSPITGRSGVAVALLYTIPELVEGKAGWYIAFYAYDPERGKVSLYKRTL